MATVTIVPEALCSELIDEAAAFEAVAAVFAAMARSEARNFPVVREAIGYEDAFYGFKGGFDRAGLTLGVKAGGYWPNNLKASAASRSRTSIGCRAIRPISNIRSCPAS